MVTFQNLVDFWNFLVQNMYKITDVQYLILDSEIWNTYTKIFLLSLHQFSVSKTSHEKNYS
jgi:hypothetical protein